MIGINENNYFCTPEGDRVEKYEPGVFMKLDGTLVGAQNIKIQYGGTITVETPAGIEPVDYPYYNHLVKCGYIVYKNYDTEHSNYKDSTELKTMLGDNTKHAMRRVLEGMGMGYAFTPPATWMIYDEWFKYTIIIDTVDRMVERNLTRKDNNLRFYPFDKNVDKYGTRYLSIFVEPLKIQEGSDKFKIPNDIVKELIKKLGSDYHFNPLRITSKVIYCQNL